MTELWYYTSAGKQMEPVTPTELADLAGTGFLRPGDLVWKEGMTEWVKASALGHLFPAGALEAQPYSHGPEFQPAIADALPVPIVHEDDDDEPRPRRRGERRSRRDEPRDFRRRDKPPVKGIGGLGIGLIIGGVALAMGIVMGLIGYFASKSGPAVHIAEFSVELKPNEHKTREFHFKKGTLYEITVTCTHDTDVDLYVNNQNDEAVAKDDNPGPRSFLRWSPTTSGPYRIEVENLDGFRGNTATVKIRSVGTSRLPVSNLEIPEKRFRWQQPDGPPDFGEIGALRGNVEMKIKALQRDEDWETAVFFPVEKQVQLKVVADDPRSSIGLFVFEGEKEVAALKGPGSSPQVTFVARANGTYRFVVVNVTQRGGPRAAVNCTVTYTRP